MRALGRLLFSKKATFRQLVDDARDDAVIKRTKLTPEFDYADLRAEYSDDGFIPLMSIQGKTVDVATLDGEFEPQAGWMVLSLVKKEES